MTMLDKDRSQAEEAAYGYSHSSNSSQHPSHYMEHTTAPPPYQRQNDIAESQSAAVANRSEGMEADMAILFKGPPYVPTLKSSRNLSKPIALPQVNETYDSTFLRGWAPDLEDYGVPPPVWLQFLQGLEICMVASPPLQCIGRSAQGLSVEAYHWAVSGSVSMIDNARPSVRLLRKSLTEQYLCHANSEIFESRGLKARLIRGGALQKFIRLLNPTTTKAKAVAKGSEKLVRSIPIVGLAASIVLGIGKGITSAVVPVANLASQSLFVQGVLGSVASDVARLQVDNVWPSPPLEVQDANSSLYQTLRAASARKREAEQAHRERLGAIGRGQLTLDESVINASVPEWHNSRDRRKLQRRQARNLQRAYKHPQRFVPRASYLETNAIAHNNNDSPAMSKSSGRADYTLWLIVYPVEQDKWVRDVHKLDSTAPIEIDEDEYADILRVETEEDLRYRNI